MLSPLHENIFFQPLWIFGVNKWYYSLNIHIDWYSIFIIILYSGLDFALLQKVRREIIHRENAGDEEEYEEEIKGGLISEDGLALVSFDMFFL